MVYNKQKNEKWRFDRNFTDCNIKSIFGIIWLLFWFRLLFADLILIVWLIFWYCISFYLELYLFDTKNDHSNSRAWAGLTLHLWNDTWYLDMYSCRFGVHKSLKHVYPVVRQYFSNALGMSWIFGLNVILILILF